MSLLQDWYERHWAESEDITPDICDQSSITRSRESSRAGWPVEPGQPVLLYRS